MNKIYTFLIFCSRASNEVLKKCPDLERTKYASLGATVFLTAIFSLMSSYYGFYLITNNISYSIIFGTFWGIVIFNLDRFILSTFRKTNNPFKNILVAFPRILLGILIAIVSSKPLEVKLFEKEITLQLNKSNSEIYREYIKPQQEEVFKLKTEIQGLDSLISRSPHILKLEDDYARTQAQRV